MIWVIDIIVFQLPMFDQSIVPLFKEIYMLKEL